MVLLSLVCFGLGLGMGLVSLAAHLQPATWIKRYRKTTLLVLAGLAGCLGGWTGVWLFGRLFATATSLWMAGLIVLIIPWSSTFTRSPISVTMVTKLKEMRK